MAKKQKINSAEFEIKFYEGILRRSPNFVEALSAIGDLYTKEGMYEKGLKVDEKLFSIRGNDPIVLYNLACSYSLLNKLDKAFLMFKKAISNGYSDMEHLDRDTDLDNLKKTPKFKKYLAKIHSNRSIQKISTDK